MAPARPKLDLLRGRFFASLFVGLSVTTGSWALDVIDGPTLLMNPSGLTPLAGVIELTTDTPSRVTLAITDGSTGWAAEFPDFQTNHAVQLRGLEPNSQFTIDVTVTGQVGGGFDTFHTNAVMHDPEDDAIIVSVRHQDAVVKFSRKTGEIHWILGPHANWPPEFEPYLLEPIGG